MVGIRHLLKAHRPVVVLVGIILALTMIPIFEIVLVLGDSWQGIPPGFTNESFYQARVQAIVKGHPAGGEPYFFEHRDDPPLVIFGGIWLNAIPQLAGLSLNASLLINFILWSLLFTASAYWLFRELRTPPWLAVFGVTFLYLQGYEHIVRVVNLQTVYPFFFLFYVVLLRFIREQNRKNTALLALATGATFYIYAYLWQAVVITLGILFVYAFLQRNWKLLKATLFSLFVGSAIGLPVPLYALWLSHASPYFWESAGRLGLVNTHLPMAEVVYSGGWVAVVVVFLSVLCVRSRTFLEDKEFVLLGSFIAIGGLGLWIMQGSNLITGKLLETGQHLRLFIFNWLVFATISIGVFLWRRYTQISGRLRVFSVTMVAVLLAVNAYSLYSYFFIQLFPSNIDRAAWLTDELSAKPLAWLENEEKNPVVVWGEPNDSLTSNLPVFTKHYTLYVWAGMMELMPEDEIRERYLVSQYFNNPTAADLKSPAATRAYLGRHDAYHAAKTIERKIKICRILFFWDTNKDCGAPPTSQSLLGDAFFTDLGNRFQNDIKPNIKVYLKKYHVSYILKDKILDPHYEPEVLGARLVYSDDRYEIWRL
ncbi:hypothetical protein A3I46_01245 [Candidatus Kaiserbacteria bacterium RIFCSPLOWO2_02_FULL_54_13]|uniref:Glycosyltransferase RgtA/B/C/D-like domain-containing protein n=1 Tax=Candidatus Kaiserbacteria bacterium RIFCSPHIGHO2_02_FULL_54_22 TaxID=1798495 RepID=A0A1F6DJ63_9BACT|nr:MAG: hypothetical protein A3C19_01660 [Candidatus Kaiserbacteria bacterium RIFCSPHIGHO2_02_FULL_54_22]OGG68544.1 MAG: hypothetical protein A3E99_00170 [Candidatus Kaiserbacteria bacterium RIFCSPHIGHO2_12_FULL_54_16]OGG83960.1 MAG: hypothetical protein A3I46_01245 [Candidatus Kaiserbacteria bacterium RIFCSPLOWO2_02_FULL_54_13]OGG89910.1 MAG: hypothetical protein A3G12_01555 [Candidatus Kaiserbacteria bacterium RIFCSPLOWO2_12_FULL_54_10]